MNVITLASRKGGAGKSTLTAQLAAQAHAQGKRVLVVDADPQGSLKLWHALRPDALPKLVGDRVQLQQVMLNLLSNAIDAAAVGDRPTREVVVVADRCGEGVSVEVIDLRTLVPLDKEAIRRTVEKTSRVLVLHEDVLTAGFGGEISALIAEHHFDSLDAPVRRIGAADTPVGYAPDLEDAILPQVDGITEAIRQLARY